MFSSTGAGSFGSPASCSLVAVDGARSTCQLTFTPSGPGPDTITAAYSGNVIDAASNGTALLTVLARPFAATSPFAKPSNSFTLSRLKLNKRNGSATVIATVPGPGMLRLAGTGVKRLIKSVGRAVRVKLTVWAGPSTRRKLGRTGNAPVTVKVTYTPVGGDPNTKSDHLTLRRGRR